MLSKYLSKLLWIALLALIGLNAYSQEYERWSTSLVGGSFAVGNYSHLEDAKIGTPEYSLITETRSVRNIISFHLLEQDTLLPDSFKCEVTVHVKWEDESSVSHNAIKTLSVCFNKDTLHNDTLVSYFEFTDGIIVEDTIIDIYVEGLTLGSLPDIFELRNTIIIDRDYEFDCEWGISTASATLDVTERELLVSWTNNAINTSLIDEYDLEWTFYDNLSELVQNYFNLTGPHPYSSASFKHNATRIVTSECHYSIPMLYENGILLFRIRPVMVLPNGQRICGEWTTSTDAGSSTFMHVILAGHEFKLNWQAATTFAEEGKRKSVISYFDGSSRNRQTVTKINTEKDVIVAETIYDAEGRPVVSTLPSPSFTQAIEYFEQFNKNISGDTYTWADVFANGVCLPEPEVMQNTSGAAKYYSANNPLKLTSFHKYIPESFGYPFSQTQYTNDLTNRVRRSAGPGKDHHMGQYAGGHEHVTKYYYGAPAQGELDMLFGAEAGEASHYFKNLVVDPNGQISVTYQDMHGRTIATALAGSATAADLEDLNEKVDSPTTLLDTIINRNMQTIDGTSIIYSKTFTVSSAGPHTFYYSLSPESYEITACDSSEFCFDCVYDLEIRITDACNNITLPGDTPMVIRKINYVPAESIVYYFDTLCGDTVLAIIDSFQTDTLLAGEYTVTKILTIKPEAVDYYYDFYLRNDTCIKTFDDFYSDALAEIDFSGCEFDCAKCDEMLGDSSAFVTSFITKLTDDNETYEPNRLDTANAIVAYEHLKRTCDIMCDSFSVCDMKYQLLLADMGPTGGQYADYVYDETTDTYSSTNTTSIFSVDATIYGDVGGIPLYQSDDIVYENEFGIPDTLYIDWDGDTDEEIDTVLPNQLSIKQFIQYWKPSWGHALVPYHPEYCYYQFCESISASHEYDQYMLSVDNYDDALSEGLFNPIGETEISSSCGMCGFTNTSLDPFFADPDHSLLKDYMLNKMKVYVNEYYSGVFYIKSIWELAAISASCADTVISCDDCTKDIYWNTFRNIYLGLKKQRVDGRMVGYYRYQCKGTSELPADELDFSSGDLQGKTQRFEILRENNDFYEFEDNPPSMGNAANNEAEAQNMIDTSSVVFHCRDYATYWWGKLDSCIFDKDSATVVNELIAVCELGRDETHIYGASTTAPDPLNPPHLKHTANNNSSFEDVLEWAGVDVATASCTHYLITNPQPYYINTLYYQTALINRPEECVCDRIDEFKAQHIVSGSALSFVDYLNQVRNVVISENDLQLIMEACTTTTCSTLLRPVTLPYQLACDRVCATCTQVKQVYANYLNTFGNNVVNHPDNMSLLQSYMNTNLSMNLTALEYLEFMSDSCGVTDFDGDEPVPMPLVKSFEDTDSKGKFSKSIDTYNIFAYSDVASVPALETKSDRDIQKYEVSALFSKKADAVKKLVDYKVVTGNFIPFSKPISVPLDINVKKQVWKTEPIKVELPYAYINKQNKLIGKQGTVQTKPYLKLPAIVGDSANEKQVNAHFEVNRNSSLNFERNDMAGNIGDWRSKANDSNKLTAQDYSDSNVSIAPVKKDLFSGKRAERQLPVGLQPSKDSKAAFQTPALPQFYVLSSGSWCDSLEQVVDSFTAYGGVYQSTLAFTTEVESNLGHYEYDFADWILQMDSCGIPCSLYINCSTAASAMADFAAENPSLEDTCFPIVWVNYMNANYASGTGRTYNAEEWIALLECCDISYPVPQTYNNYCDSLHAVVSFYSTVYPGVPVSMYKEIFGNGHWEGMTYVPHNLNYWYTEIFDSCNLDEFEDVILRCEQLDSLMEAFDSIYPGLADSCLPAFLIDYLQESLPYGSSVSYGEVEWIATLERCNVPYPVMVTGMDYCDTLLMVTEQYSNTSNSFSNDLGDWRDLLNSMFGNNSYDGMTLINHTNDYWITQLQICSLSCVLPISCSSLYDVEDEFYYVFSEHDPYSPWNPEYDSTVSPIKWYGLFNSQFNTDLSVESWNYFFACCSIQLPLFDSVTTFCDTLAIKLVTIGQEEDGPWGWYGLANELNSAGLGRYGDSIYWKQTLDTCGYDCNYIGNSGILTSVLLEFYDEYPEYEDTVPAEFFVNYLNEHILSGYPYTLNAADWLEVIDCRTDYEAPVLIWIVNNTNCDTLAARLAIAYTEGISYWDFIDNMRDLYGNGYSGPYGWVNYPDSHWFELIDSCNLPCPQIIDCELADSIMSDFYDEYPQYDTSAPAFWWVSYLNEHGVGDGNWYNEYQYRLMLNCCEITLPASDTLGDLCDTLDIIVSFSQGVSQFPDLNLLHDLRQAFGWGYTPPGGEFTQYTFSYWINLLDSCGIPCSTLVDCIALDSVLNDLIDENPEYADSCPDFVITKYLGRYLLDSDDELTYDEWRLIAQCCDIDFPDNDTTPDLCDTVVSMYTFIQAMQSYLEDSTTVSCIPAWTYVMMLQEEGFEMSMTEICAALSTCGYPCPDTCVYTTYCDSLLSTSRIIDLIIASGDEPLSEEEALEIKTMYVNYVMGTSFTESQLTAQLLLCDTNDFCEGITPLYSFLDNLFDSYGPCVPASIYVSSLNYYTSYNFDYADWCALLADCSIPCADTCLQAPPQSHCDSVLLAYEQYQHVIQVFEVGDSADAITTIFSSYFGYPVSDTLAWEWIWECDSVCERVYNVTIGLSTLFDTYGSCAPAWAVELAYSLNLPDLMPLYYSEICAMAQQCGLPCPDTCNSTLVTNCDSVLQFYTLYNQAYTLYGSEWEDPEAVFTGMTYIFFGTPYTHAQFLSMIDSCNEVPCLEGAEEAYTQLAPVFEQYGPCVPAWVVVMSFNQVLDLPSPLSYTQICNMLGNCELPCPDTCGSIGNTTCDSILAVYNLWRNSVDAYPTDPDSMSRLTVIQLSILGYAYPPPFFFSLVNQCDSVCEDIEDAQEGLNYLFSLYGECVPAWVVEFAYTAFMQSPTPLSYHEVCNILQPCNLPCPDTCGGPPGTHCDSINAAITLWRHLVYDLEVNNDSLELLELVQFSIFGTTWDYGTFVIEMANACGPAPVGCDTIMMIYREWRRQICEHPPTHVPDVEAILAEVTEDILGYSVPYSIMLGYIDECDSCAYFYDELLDTYEAFFNSFNGCTPAWAVEYVFNSFYCTNQHYGQICSNLSACSIPCPDTCTLGTSCDTIMSIYYAVDGALDHYLGTDTAGMVYLFTKEVYGTPMSVSTFYGLVAGCMPSEPVLCNRPLLPPITFETDDSCYAIMQSYAYTNASVAYEEYMRNHYQDFVNGYIQKCLGAWQHETLIHKFQNAEYHFTLYYYDQAGNLVKTIPPKGVDVVSQNHTYPTIYRYNTLNQVVEQRTPDAGTTFFWYDRIGKLTHSVNAKQAILNQVSYTRYDALQRIVEVGRMDGYSPDAAYGFWDNYILTNPDLWYTSAQSANALFEVTHTYYDDDVLSMGGTNLRNRVASTTYEDVWDNDITTYESGLHYDYDIHGSVKQLTQEIPMLSAIGQSVKKLDYEYDLISGKVNRVIYQKGEADQFIHEYEYDADNRITDVMTSRDNFVFAKDAHYEYYKHGPLARTVLGGDLTSGGRQVQGMDYAYTIQGWLKGVNSVSLLTGYDMGADGIGSFTAPDQFGFTLGYFNQDYQPVGWGTSVTTANHLEADYTNIDPSPLYNGNIAHMAVNVKQLNSPLAYRFRYDQLNRLLGTDAFNGLNTSTNEWDNTTALPEYKNELTYDANGNILTNLRNGGAANVNMDNMTYNYIAGTNKLDYVDDGVTPGNYAVDIDNQSAGNYDYDAIGNLIQDVAEGIDNIEWNLYGKIKKIEKANGDYISFMYDPAGNRIMKEHWDDANSKKTHTFYTRDATGNTMATYRWDDETTFKLDELVLYGSSRLGVITPALQLYPALPADDNPATSGTNSAIASIKQYELSNHLGNVQVTVSDRRLPVYVSGAFDHYEAEVVNAQDYYPFGMLMPEREFTAGSQYRYGFNGKENDNEVKGKGSQQDYGMRIYDPRLGRFLSVDPLAKDFAMLTPYQYSSNSPILCIDLDGLEGIPNTGFGSDPMATMAYHLGTYLESVGDAVGTFVFKMETTVTGWFSKDETSISPVEITNKIGIVGIGSVDVTVDFSKPFKKENYSNNTYTGGSPVTIKVEGSVGVKRQTDAKVTTPAVTANNTTSTTTTLVSTDPNKKGSTKISNEFTVSTVADGVPVVVTQQNEAVVDANAKVTSTSSSTSVGVGTPELNVNASVTNENGQTSVGVGAKAEKSIGPIDISVSGGVSRIISDQ